LTGLTRNVKLLMQKMNITWTLEKNNNRGHGLKVISYILC